MHDFNCRAGEELKNIDRKTEGKLFPQYPAVRWRGAMGMRDVLAHTYFHVDAEQLFNICKNDIPTMIAASLPSPAESVSTFAQLEKTCSAVGLRKRFCVQMNRARIIAGDS
ncbi:MAG: DUF86 domain-containing protein [Candidatus Thiothrix putei]|uniref:DUF86 domain-containing protein n=1 Tax=Candidatus Thiothrix putei TaxID=3080811 RepID=A0AA95KR23_9GAMM|nr:MAG: DUF86 domain-containing protein [Candidatus Thiothrix putei]